MKQLRKRLLATMVMLSILAISACSAVFALSPKGTPMPVLMYHHFMEQGPSQADTVVSAQRFEEQMAALQKAGYHSITPQQLVDYVNEGKELPQKPIVITMDDGYTSNLTIAAPILEKYGMTATVFVIGINVGETVYPHSGEALDPPRFSWEEAQPWVDKGVIVVQSHTYDMHQRMDYGYSGRDGVLSIKGESEQDYRAALVKDFTLSKDGLKEGLEAEFVALAFPFGLKSKIAVEEMKSLGIKTSFTTVYGCSKIYQGKADSIQCLNRWGISDQVTGEKLIAGLKKLAK